MSAAEPDVTRGYVPEPDDPLDTATAAGLHWSRSNIGEAMPGVQTPLSWSVWSGGNERAVREAAYAIGALTRAERAVPEDPAQRMIRVFRGRPAMNVEFMTVIGDRMPGTSGQEAARSLLGRVPENIVYRPNSRRYPIVAWRFPLTFCITPRRLRAFAARTQEWYPDRIAEVAGADEAAARALFVEAVDRFNEAIVIQTISVLAIVQPLYEALARLVARAGTGDLAVLSGSGGAEMAVVTDIRRAAHQRLTLDRLLAAHGFHGPAEGELSSRVWRENPAPLRALLPRYAGRPDPGLTATDPAAGTDPTAQGRSMRRDVLRALPVHHRPGAWLLMRLAARHIQCRGVLKRSFLQCFDVARAAARRLGSQLVASGALADIDDVFYLTVAEVTGELPSGGRELVARAGAGVRSTSASISPVRGPAPHRPSPPPRPSGPPGTTPVGTTRPSR